MLSVNNQRRPSVGTNITPSVGVRRPSDENLSPYNDSTYANGRPPSPLASPTFSSYATPNGPFSTLEARSRSSSVSSAHSSGGYHHDDFQSEQNLPLSNSFRQTTSDLALTAGDAAFTKRKHSPPDRIVTDLGGSALDYPPSSSATSLTRRVHITGHTHDRSRSTSIDGDIEDSAWPLERVLRWLDDNGFKNKLYGEDFFALTNLMNSKIIKDIDSRSKLITAIRKLRDSRPKRQSFSEKDSQTLGGSPPLENMQSPITGPLSSTSSVIGQFSPTNPNIPNGSTFQNKLKLSTSVPELRNFSQRGPITSPIINPRTSSIGWDRESNKSLSPNSAIPEHEFQPSISAGLKFVAGISMSHLPEQSHSFAASHSHNFHNQPVVQQHSVSKTEDKNISPQSSRRQTKYTSHNRSQSHSSNDSALFSADPPKQRWIQVTDNMKTFTATEITDLEDINSIKDTIFSQLRIDCNEKENYTIHVTEFGQKEGPPISDLDLMQKCMNVDDRGNLKLLVKRKQLQNDFNSIAEDPQDMNRFKHHRRRQSSNRVSGSPPQDLTLQDNEVHHYDKIHRKTASGEFQNENYSPNRIDYNYNWNCGTSPRLQRHPASLQPANGAIRRHTSREHIPQAPMSIPLKPHTVSQPHNQSQYYGVGPYNQYPNKYSKSQPHLPMLQNPLSMNLHELPENESPYVHKHIMSSEPDLTLRKSDIQSQNSNVVFPDNADEKPLWAKLPDSSSTRIDEEISIWAKPPKPTNPPRSSNVSSPVDTSHQITDKNNDGGRLLSNDEELSAKIHKRTSLKQNDNQIAIDRNPANSEQNNLPENAEPNNKEVDEIQSITSQSQQTKKRNTGGLARTVSKRRGVKVEESWIERPTAEDIFEDIEQYFPNHDVDMPIVDAQGSTQNSSPSDVPLPQTMPASAAILEKSGVTVSRVKSIRVVAREARERERTNRKSVEATAVKEGKLGRRPTTKLWDKRVVEQRPTGKKAPCISGSDEDCTEKKPVKWAKGRLIGKGNFGKVYIALNLSSSEVMAVKQIEQPLTPSDKRNERHQVQIKSFKDEMKILKDLSHDNIVSYIGYEETEEYINIFLEYVNGGSIGTVLRSNGPFDERVVKSFTRQILEGLQYLHNQKILHRDIKADNILVDEDGCCKISDFGISKRSDVTTMFKLGSEKKSPPISENIKSEKALDFLNQCFIINPDLRPTAEDLLKNPFTQDDPKFNLKDFIKIPHNNNTVPAIPEDHENAG
ncbi:34075_t:CDS:10 [Racocetra persica]|uniref:34075_t:CDS:1 n=1 Tax=Racocetra persica TaxID=160502 RepID=A0ACA9KL96_9GLOM|nr:34075_t:CDS:10 [Racocetra persica]